MRGIFLILDGYPQQLYNNGTSEMPQAHPQIVKALLQQAGFPQDPSTLIDTNEAAEVLGLKAQTLINWRNTKRYALPYTRLGSRIRYRLGDLWAFAEKNRVVPERGRKEAGKK